MRVRSLAYIQIILGIGFLLAGCVIIAVYLWATMSITTDLSEGVKVFADQVDHTATTIDNQQKVFEEFDLTAESYKTLLQTVKHSADELAKQKDSWNKLGDDLNQACTLAGQKIRGVGEAIDIKLNPVVEWGKTLGVPYPNGIHFESVEMLHKNAAELGIIGDNLITTGETIKSTVAKSTDEFGNLQRAMGETSDSSIKMVETVRTSLSSVRTQDMPLLVGEMRESHNQLVRVSENIKLIGPLLVSLGCVGLGAAIICVLNAMTLLAFERRLTKVEASGRAAGDGL